MDILTLEEKIFGLSTFWSEVKYNFTYFENTPNLDWDITYQQYLSKILHSNSDFEYYRILEQFAATLKDGHTLIDIPQELKNLTGKPNIEVKNLNKNVFITNIEKSLADKIPIGSEIIEINNTSTQDYIINKVLAYVSASTEQMRWELAISKYLLCGMLNEKVIIKYKSPHDEITLLELKRTPHDEQVNWLVAHKKIPEINLSWLKNSIAYIKLSSFNNDVIIKKFKSYFNALLNADGIILDLRNNSGGNNYYALKLAHYFTKENIKQGQEKARINISSKRAHGSLIKNFKHLAVDDPSSNAEKNDALAHINGESWHTIEQVPISNDLKINTVITAPLILLTNIYTASAAEDFLIYLDSVNRGTRVGQATTGSTGAPILLSLPGGGTGLICSKKSSFRNGRQFVGIGIQPHLHVEKSLSSVLSQEDLELEIAVSNLTKKNKTYN